MRDVHIREVGPRDGLQNARQRMPTDAKRRWIDALAAAGLVEIEVGSFVPPQLIPAMADTGEIVRHALRIRGLAVVALAPNVKGFERALEAGAHKVTFPVSASRVHSEKNVRRTPEQMVDQVRESVARRDALPADRRPGIEGAISTAFGCTMQGEVPLADVVRLARLLAEAGVDAVALADTVGYANPAQIRATVHAVRTEIGARLGSLHLHDTRGLGLANALAGFEAGVRHFDASLGGLGGCPFAPGASGNVITEDLVFMFEAMGVHTGIDFERLLEARAVMIAGVPDEPVHGRTPLAGLPRGFRPAL